MLSGEVFVIFGSYLFSGAASPVFHETQLTEGDWEVDGKEVLEFIFTDWINCFLFIHDHDK